ncbi:pro-sigmaK processing inhibitor BofA family protein [Metabacillus iocasae]|uniref:Inhibitor of the pro-sigma K processing machinery n=1 Tax=Priestia iocasae TaxID=2291674 RepID=A0ABS2R1J0_9BACI|nr:pro-sigmaK processing inhibitor BofA family protein [Metabacillus iocasae]MBM7705087.1 inhibitor of the pro-sigma K processing machinery [Metabacillus iocasae]
MFEPVIVIPIIGGLILLLLLAGGTTNKILRLIGQGSIKLVIGALFLFFVNVIGAQMDIHVPINVVTTSISGILGIPGLIALIIINNFIL